jgi:hypothetical protein
VNRNLDTEISIKRGGSPLDIAEEAFKLCQDIEMLMGSDRSHWSMQIQGSRKKRLAEAEAIIIRAKLLKEIVKRHIGN